MVRPARTADAQKRIEKEEEKLRGMSIDALLTKIDKASLQMTMLAEAVRLCGTYGWECPADDLDSVRESLIAGIQVKDPEHSMECSGSFT